MNTQIENKISKPKTTRKKQNKEMSIDVKFLQDFPNSTITELLMGTEVRMSDLIFGARYPILLIRSLEI